MKNHIQTILFLIILMVLVPFSAFAGNPKSSDHSKERSSLEAAPLPTQSNITDPDNITIFHHDTQKVETLPMADYLKGVVIAEMPATFETEAIKAQAVIAHTYTLRIIENEKRSPSADLNGASISTDPSKHQAYLSVSQAKEKYKDQYETYSKKIGACVDEVMNQILTYNNEPIVAAFHAISSGNTEAAENVWGKAIPYLIKTDSEGDLLSPSYENSLTLTSDEVKNILSQKYPELTFSDDKSDWFQITSTTPSGYVSAVTVLNKQLSGQEIRTLFHLKSSDFTVSFSDDKFTFVTKGYGHGVGLSQYGADYMARQGSSYQDILSHYYPNTILCVIA